MLTFFMSSLLCQRLWNFQNISKSYFYTEYFSGTGHFKNNFFCPTEICQYLWKISKNYSFHRIFFRSFLRRHFFGPTEVCQHVKIKLIECFFPVMLRRIVFGPSEICQMTWKKILCVIIIFWNFLKILQVLTNVCRGWIVSSS